MRDGLKTAVARGYGAVGRLRKLITVILTISAFPAAAETVTVAALGDSLVQGYGLPQEEGLVPQLQAWLDGQGADTEVINAGVSGDTTAGGLARAAWTLTPEVDALIVALGGNDLLRGIDPALARANIEGILQAARAAEVAVLLVGIAAPGNYGPDYKRDFDAIFPELSQAYGAIYYPGFFEAFLAEGEDPSTATQYMQSDGIHPNALGVAAIVEDFGPAVLGLVNGAE